MTKFNFNSAKFLDKETDVKHKDTLEIASEGEWEESKTFKNDKGEPSKQYTINLKLANGEERSTILSFANIKLLCQGFGDESSTWVGQKVRAWKTVSAKAKIGYVYFYVPIDWDRDDTGEWIIPASTDTSPVTPPVPDFGDAPVATPKKTK